MDNDKLCEYISSNLSGCSTEPLTVYVLQSSAVQDCSLFPGKTALRQDRLIFVSQSQPQEMLQGQTADILITAMAVSEYLVNDEISSTSYVYVEKIDSTGYRLASNASRPSTRATILAYLTFAREFLPGHIITAHIFARSQPAYLFCGSEHNARKRVLGDRALVKWWMKTLSSLQCVGARGSWLVPGESERTMADVARIADQSATVKWNWGWPWSTDINAADVVPRFPDDAKSKVLSNYSNQQLHMEEFEELLQITGECKDRVSGFFIVKLQQDGGQLAQAKAASISAPAPSRKDFDTFICKLMAADFSTIKAAVQSSAELIGLLREMPAAHSKVPRQGLMAAAEIPTFVASNPVNIQSIVKKKHAPPTETVNVVQTLVKRKTVPKSMEATIKPSKRAGDSEKRDADVNKKANLAQ